MKTVGDQDPVIPTATQAAHDAACARREEVYFDPLTGGMVMTAYKLYEMGYCCGNGCRHCPWPSNVQAEAGRGVLRD